MQPRGGAALKLPGCFERVLDGSGVTAGEIGDDHHVLNESGGDVEGLRELPYHRVAVVEIRTYHQMLGVERTCDQPAAVPPLGQPRASRAPHASQRLSQPSHLT
jgi:hypothetical protein